MLILGGFNAEIDESQMKSFDETNNLKKLIKHPNAFGGRFSK